MHFVSTKTEKKDTRQNKQTNKQTKTKATSCLIVHMIFWMPMILLKILMAPTCFLSVMANSDRFTMTSIDVCVTADLQS